MPSSTPSLPRAAGQAAHTLPRLVTHRGINTQGIDHGLPHEFRGYADVPPPNTHEPVFAAFGRTAEETERRHAFIVRACNSYAGLVTFAERVASWDGNPEAMSVTVRAELIRQAVELNSALNSAK